MRNFCIIFLSLIIISLTAVGFSGELSKNNQNIGAEYLRIHIRADSNEAEAQAVKYKVRDRVVEYLTPIVASCQTKAESLQSIAGALQDIQRMSQSILYTSSKVTLN